MSDDALMRMLADKPALRHACARTEAESEACRVQYWTEQGVPREDADHSRIRTRDVRSELHRLLGEVRGV